MIGKRLTGAELAALFGVEHRVVGIDRALEGAEIAAFRMGDRVLVVNVDEYRRNQREMMERLHRESLDRLTREFTRFDDRVVATRFAFQNFAKSLELVLPVDRLAGLALCDDVPIARGARAPKRKPAHLRSRARRKW